MSVLLSDIAVSVMHAAGSNETELWHSCYNSWSCSAGWSAVSFRCYPGLYIYLLALWVRLFATKAEHKYKKNKHKNASRGRQIQEIHNIQIKRNRWKTCTRHDKHHTKHGSLLMNKSVNLTKWDFVEIHSIDISNITQFHEILSSYNKQSSENLTV